MMRFLSSTPSRPQCHVELLRWIIVFGFLTLYYSFPLSSIYNNNNNNKQSVSVSIVGGTITAKQATTTTNLRHHQNEKNTDHESTTTSSSFQYVFWLLPAEPYLQELQQLIHELAVEYDTIPFEPHITLAPPVPSENIPHPQVTLDQFVQQQHDETTTTTSMALDNYHVAVGQLYTQSVFLQFQEPNDNNNQHDASYAMLRRLYECSRELSGLSPLEPPNPQDHFPHMSLMYQNSDIATRTQIAKRVQEKLQSSLLLQPILFDAIQLVQIQLPVTSDQDVQKWKTIGKRYISYLHK